MKNEGVLRTEMRETPLFSPAARKVHKSTCPHLQYFCALSGISSVWQCLDRRIDNIKTLRQELAAWECEKNNEEKKVVWQFRTKDARIKLASLYPKLG